MTTSQQPSTLPSREHFLLNGLKSVSYAPDQASECGICLDDFTELVKLGCHDTHLFCLDCIWKWLKQSDCCPMCKVKLFYTAENSPKAVAVAQATDILRNRGHMHNMDHFGAGPFLDTDEDHRNLNQSGSNARWWLRRGYIGPGRVNVHDEIRLTNGTGFIHTTRLAMDFAMMGNYIPIISEVRNRPYSAQQKEQWTLVMITLWNILWKHNGKSLNTSPDALHKRLRKKLKGLPDFDRIQFVRRHSQGFDDNRLRADLTCMLDFVAYLTQKEQRRQTRLQGGQQQGRWKKFAPVKEFLKQLGPSNWGRFRYL